MSKADRIRRYREIFDVGLIEARRAVESEDRLAQLEVIRAKLKTSWGSTNWEGVDLLVNLLREIV